MSTRPAAAATPGTGAPVPVRRRTVAPAASRAAAASAAGDSTAQATAQATTQATAQATAPSRRRGAGPAATVVPAPASAPSSGRARRTAPAASAPQGKGGGAAGGAAAGRAATGGRRGVPAPPPAPPKGEAAGRGAGAGRTTGTGRVGSAARASDPPAAAGGASSTGRRGGRKAEPVLGPTGRPRPVFPEPPPVTRHGPARVLAMCNQKGGVGKTTSTINLGAALAEVGRRVLLVDLDPQGALSVGLGVNPLQLDRTVYNLLLESGVRAEDVMLRTAVPGVDLLPSNIDLSAAEVQLVNEVAREQALRRVLDPVRADYDVVLIDCQPSLGLLTVNALTAADGVIVPLECEYFALRGVALLLQTIEKIRERLNPQLEIEGLLATMYDARTLHGREVLARVVDAFGDKVFHTVVNRTIRFAETTVAGEPITSYASTSTGAEAYRELARELLAREAAR